MTVCVCDGPETVVGEEWGREPIHPLPFEHDGVRVCVRGGDVEWGD